MSTAPALAPAFKNSLLLNIGASLLAPLYQPARGTKNHQESYRLNDVIEGIVAEVNRMERDPGDLDRGGNERQDQTGEAGAQFWSPHVAVEEIEYCQQKKSRWKVIDDDKKEALGEKQDHDGVNGKLEYGQHANGPGEFF